MPVFNSSSNAYFISRKKPEESKEKLGSSLSSSSHTQIYIESETDHTPNANIFMQMGGEEVTLLNSPISIVLRA